MTKKRRSDIQKKNCRRYNLYNKKRSSDIFKKLPSLLTILT